MLLWTNTKEEVCRGRSTARSRCLRLTTDRRRQKTGPRSICSLPDSTQNLSRKRGWVRHGKCAPKICLTRGCSRKNCAQFFAHPRSKTTADRSSQAGKQIASTGARNQHDSCPSHQVVRVSAATVNRRVASSNLARATLPVLCPLSASGRMLIG
jgi:hypothetical protein